ncbi:uncharacterized protein [Miscanthus floridulus]|uniref:uncharacterized protein isoform X4 n=1 Tax=Miscanthus floridulus TaxID=154761 RepID=UPI0034592E4D
MDYVAAAAIATTSRSLPLPFSSTPLHPRRRAAFLPVAASKRHDDDEEAAKGKGSGSGPGREPTSLAPYGGLSISPLSRVRTRRRLTRRNHPWCNPTAPRPDSLGRSHGTGGECCHGERLDDGIGDGGPPDGEQGRCGGQAGGVNAALVPLHQITAAAYAGGLHLQRVRAAHDQGHQSSCLHRWNCVCSVLWLQCVP